MNLLNILQQYAERPTDTHADFEEVVGQVPQNVLGDGLAKAFGASSGPPFGQAVSHLFGNSNPQQRAGLLGQLLGAVGPALLSTIAGGALSRFGLGGGSGSAPARHDATPLTPTEVASITPAEAGELAAAAQRSDPGILDRVGAFYAQHPDVVKTLGGAALAIALGQMAQRMRN